MYMAGLDDKNAREWIFLLDAQRGVVANAEARQAGLSVKAIRHQLSSGRWKRVRRGVYATFTGQPPRMVALTLRRNGWQGNPRPCRRKACALRGTTQTWDTLGPRRGPKYPTSSSPA